MFNGLQLLGQTRRFEIVRPSCSAADAFEIPEQRLAKPFAKAAQQGVAADEAAGRAARSLWPSPLNTGTLGRQEKHETIVIGLDHRSVHPGGCAPRLFQEVSSGRGDSHPGIPRAVLSIRLRADVRRQRAGILDASDARRFLAAHAGSDPQARWLPIVDRHRMEGLRGNEWDYGDAWVQNRV